MNSHHCWISLSSPAAPFLFVPIPISAEQERAMLQTVQSWTCSRKGTPAADKHCHVAAVVYLAFPQWRLWFGLVCMPSLLLNCCLPGRLETSPPFHTWLAVVNVLKRYKRREIDTRIMWCPGSHILKGKKTQKIPMVWPRERKCVFSCIA